MVLSPEELKRRRLMLGMTQKELAKDTEVSQSIISKFEAKKHFPGYHTLKQLEEKLTEIETSKRADAKQKTVEDVMNKNIYSFKKTDKVCEVIKVFKKRGISQAPVMEQSNPHGLITAKGLLDSDPDDVIDKLLEPEPPVISNETTIQSAKILLKQFPLLLINKKGKIIGIVTREDIL